MKTLFALLAVATVSVSSFAYAAPFYKTNAEVKRAVLKSVNDELHQDLTMKDVQLGAKRPDANSSDMKEIAKWLASTTYSAALTQNAINKAAP
jgi:hypothetical protein